MKKTTKVRIIVRGLLFTVAATLIIATGLAVGLVLFSFLNWVSSEILQCLNAIVDWFTNGKLALVFTIVLGFITFVFIDLIHWKFKKQVDAFKVEMEHKKAEKLAKKEAKKAEKEAKKNKKK